MRRRGEVFENPATGERVVVLTDPEEHPDNVLVAHLFVRPGGRVAMAHSHPTLTERFHVLGGRVGFMIDGERRTLAPGETAEVPPGVVHDWWQEGDEEASVVVEVAPGERFVEMVGTLFGLARDGKVDERGRVNPLQLAVSVREYSDVMVVAKPPPWLQKIVFGALAPIGRMRGLAPSYERYLSSDVVVEPDPAALALLSPTGQLDPSNIFRE